MNLGGPVWHASACDHTSSGRYEELEKAARKALKGVGDPSLGEWIERNDNRFVHVRRRLTIKEAIKIGEVIDIRNTQEAIDRVNAIWSGLPLVVRNTIMKDGPF